MSFNRDLIRFPEAIDNESYVIATYYLETPMDMYEAANAFAAEQSSGTWKRVGDETDELRERHGIKVIGVYPTPGDFKQNLPTGVPISEFGRPIKAAVLRLAFPHINFGPKMPNLLTAVAGNLYEMGAFTAIRLMDLEFPKSFLKDFTGPKFGIKGCRDILNIYNRPIVGAIIKPCVGLSADRLAELAYRGAKGGLDFIKDDELLADTAYNSIKERVKKVVAALKRAEKETGERKMYAFNITDRMDRIKELHDIVVEEGGNCVMINVATAGLEAMRELAEYTKVPIHCHRDFAPMWSRSPYIGISFPALTKLFRLCGADQIHCGAIQGKLYEPDEEVLWNMRSCTLELGNIKDALPVSSGGQWAGKSPVNARKIGHYDFIHLSGAGTYAHPDGPEAGARSIRQAWDAVLKNIPLEEYAKDHKELSRAIEYFGKISY
ncbi:MAG: RuBisCO large subunit C-terminal-like domain-containing protein [Nitrospirota bacterium]